MNISPHFTFEEMTHSDTAVSHRLPNDPTVADLANLTRLCNTLLERIRSMIDSPLHINSGFRSPQVNKLVGGAPGSAHMTGRAADFICPASKLTITAIWILIKDSDLPYDQLIIENSPRSGATWIHVAVSREGIAPRREAFTLTKREARLANG